MRSTLSAFHSRVKAFGKRYRAVIFFTAFTVFVLGLFMTVKAFGLKQDDLAIKPLLVVLFLTQPFLILLNSLEFKLCGHAVQAKMSLQKAVQVSCSATLANILPLPAGLIVRGGALTQRGASLGSVSQILLVAGIMWMSVALMVSGAVISAGYVSKLICLAGGGLTIALVIYISRMCNLKIAFGFLFIRILMVGLLALQLKLCFATLGESVSLRGSAVYVVSGIAGAVVSIVPAGLGLTESFAAVLAKLDGASSALAYIGLSLNRIVGLLMAAAAFLLMSINSFNTSKISLED